MLWKEAHRQTEENHLSQYSLSAARGLNPLTLEYKSGLCRYIRRQSDNFYLENISTQNRNTNFSWYSIRVSQSSHTPTGADVYTHNFAAELVFRLAWANEV
jgi:hypothetical protein